MIPNVLFCLYRYIVLVGKPTSLYFNAILIRSCTVNVERSSLDTLEFENSAQGRHFLTYPIRFSGAEVILMTSHLESCGSETSERKRQFNDILLYMRRRPNGVNVIFGGDTNLRDNEVVAVGGLPDEVCDTWVTCGSPTEAEFTWDMSENDNMVMPDGREPRLRFDQIFLRSAQTGKVVKPQYSPILGNNDWAVEDLQVITGEYGWNLASSEKFICSYLLHGLDI